MRFSVLKFWLVTHHVLFFQLEVSDTATKWISSLLQTFWKGTGANKFAVNVTHSECAGLTVHAQLSSVSRKHWYIMDALNLLHLHCMFWSWICWMKMNGRLERDWSIDIIFYGSHRTRAADALQYASQSLFQCQIASAVLAHRLLCV